MWTCLFCVLLFPTVSSLDHPTNVTFTSVNFRNILQWSPGKHTPADTKYRIRYAIYGDKEKRVWRSVLHCTDITRTWCDLSEETSDLEHAYYAKVRAVSRKGNSEWVWTQKRFYPKIETEFGPPHVSVEVDDKYAIVTVEGPMKYLPHNKTLQVSMATLFPEMIYNLSINNTRSGRIRLVTLTKNQFKFRMTDQGAELCFSARTQLTYMPSKHHPSAWHCITTPEDPLIDPLERIVIISIAVPVVLLCLLAAGGYILYKYLLGTDQKSPVTLTMPGLYSPPLSVQPEIVNFFVIPVSKDDVPINKLHPKLTNSSPASQRHQAPPIVDVPDNSETVDYGFVVRSDDVGHCDVKNQGYKAKQWLIAAKSSGSTYASQNSFLETSLSSTSPNQFREGDTAPLQETESTNDDEGESTVCSGYALQNAQALPPSNQLQLPDEYGFVSSAGYASQNATLNQPINQSDVLPDNYGLVGQEEEDSDCLQINWSPSSQRLVIPGLDLGIGSGEGGSPPRPRVHLETVFVRQPSEEEALLGAERSGSGQWGTEELMAKWDLVLSSD